MSAWDDPVAHIRALEDEVERLRGVDFATALYHHRQGALTCYDHPPTVDRPAWCCVCGEHELMLSWRDHVAEHLRAALDAR